MPPLRRAWVLLAELSGRVDPWPLLDALGGVDGVADASPAELAGAGLSLDRAARLAGLCDLEPGLPFVCAGEPAYPPALRGLPYAPPVLFYRGALDALARPCVAIVGTRRCTATGRRVAAELARAVCLAGGTVVSGMAIGIDAAAQLEALRCGLTVAVLGQGLDVALRGGAAALGERILRSGGLLLSERLPTWPAQAHSFLLRNRIIAGLCRATVVVEAGHRSGALSTARCAIEAGRELLAVPGGYRQESSEGCLDLLEQGATLVRGPESVLRAAGMAEVDATAPGTAAGPAERLLASLRVQGGSADQLADRVGVSIAELLGLLAELEAAGLVRRMPGQRYERF